jgi:hypothetical protein
MKDIVTTYASVYGLDARFWVGVVGLFLIAALAVGAIAYAASLWQREREAIASRADWIGDLLLDIEAILFWI